MHVTTIYLMLAEYSTLEQKLETLHDMIALITDDFTTLINILLVEAEIIAADRDGDLL